MSGTAAAQLIGVCALPLLARLYQPVDFGVLALYVAIANVIAIAAGGSYDMAIVMPTDDADARRLHQLALAITSFTCLVIMCLLLLFRYTLARMFDVPDLSYLALLIPLSVFATAFVRASNYWFIRRRRFALVVRTQLVQVLAMVVTQATLAAILGATPAMLVLGYVVSQLSSSLFLSACLVLERDSPPLCPSRASLFEIWALARRYCRFPRFNVPTNMLNALGQHSTSLVLSAFFPQVVVGHLSLSNRALRTPVVLLSEPVGQVMLQTLSANVRRGQSNVPIMVRTVRVLVLISIGIGAATFFFARPLFEIVFGDNWSTAGYYCILLLPTMLSRFCVKGVSNFFVYDKQDVGLAWQALYSTGSLAALAVGGILDSPELGILAFSCYGGLMYWVHLALTLKYAGGRFRNLLSLGG
jgi:O-antigen/teichoic acid export membrane protein